MKNIEELKNQIARGTEIKISSKYTNFGVIGSIVGVFVILPLILTTINITDDKGILIIASLLTLALAVLTILQFKYAVNARLNGNSLIVKSVFGNEEQITLDQIQDLKEFALKNTKYTIVKYVTSQSESQN